MYLYDILSGIAAAFKENFLWYASFAFPFFILFWIVGKKYFQRIRIQLTQRANTHHFKHDLLYSASTFLVFAILDVCFYFLHDLGYTNLYTEVADFGWPYLLISFFVVLFLDDTFFYWSHRAMHTSGLYRFFHRVHHESTDPSPLTAFAFHPSEALVENLMHVVLPFLFPIHVGVMITWQIFSMLNNVLAHLGYEIYPKSWLSIPVLKFKTASTHHNMHHQLFNGNYALYFTWWDKWMGTEFKDYETRHQAIFERSKETTNNDGFYPVEVIQVKKEANNALTLWCKDKSGRFKNYLPGQHVTLKVTKGAQTYYRTFSLSSIPHVHENFSLTIKKIESGIVTPYLHNHVKVGDVLSISSPSGQFFVEVDPAKGKEYVLIAGGSGITPLYSMLGSILTFEPKSTVTLLYANRNFQSIIFRNEIEKWQREFPERLNVIHFLSEEKKPERAIGGYITRISLEQIINTDKEKKLHFYLCGPELMTSKLMEDLQYLGIAAERINRELFHTNRSITDIQGVHAKVEAKVYNKKYTYEAKPGYTLLESALQQNIPLSFSCKSGICGMCKAKCTSGNVHIKNNQVLTDNEIKAGYILACQSVPLTNHVTISQSGHD
ncbi:MAG: sterol desaturase family protein [Flammeovirgaceae bacterium]|jgi:ferredoxin-NADP reductase/sterol desaturase/sphingolipid hydroxylase (fatty acid hydroxylase superfamily)|nr:sterol desaturase family protein [Flammeovirgaceae bacterium]